MLWPSRIAGEVGVPPVKPGILTIPTFRPIPDAGTMPFIRLNYAGQVRVVLQITVLLAMASYATALAGNVPPPLNLNDRPSMFDLLGHIALYEDKTGLEDFDAIRHKPFHPISAAAPSFGFTRSTYWIKLALDNKTAERLTTVLEIANPFLDFIDYFVTSPSISHVERYRSGARVPWDNRVSQTRYPLLYIHFAPHEQRTLFLRVQSASALRVPLFLWSEAGYRSAERFQYLCLGLFFGGMLFLIIYSIFAWFILRQRAYLYYILTIAGVGACQLALEGLVPRVTIFSQPERMLHLLNAGMGLTLIFNIVFITTFMDARARFPVLYRILDVLLVISVVNAVVLVVDFYAGIVFIFAYGIILAWALAITVGMMWFWGESQARYLFLGQVVLQVLAPVHVALMVGFIPFNLVLAQSLKVAYLAQGMFFALALADGYSIMQRRFRTMLEEQVAQRSAQLVRANDNLEQQLAERKRAEQALRESEERFRSFMNNSPNIAWMKDEEGRYVYMSKTYEKRYGVRLADCYGKTGFDLWPRELAEQFRKGDQSVLSSGQPIQMTEEITGQDGTRTCWWKFKFPVVDPLGRRYVGGIGVDITERKRAEEALQEAKDNLEARVKERTAELEAAREAAGVERQRLYDVLETLPVYVVLLTPDYYVPFANRFFRERFGESHGRRCYEYLFERSEPCEICETYTVLKTMAPHQWDWTGPDGRNYDIYDFPFIDADGSNLIMEMGIDITERKQAEDALKQTLADLTKSNADLEQFAYVASHDLQEPLRNVTTALQILEKRYKSRLSGDADQLINYAVDSARRMKDLIADLLKYSRLATRSQPIEMVDIEKVVNRAMLNLESLIERRGTKITCDKMPAVRGDSTQLLRLFQNLIGNAVKFGRPESPQVHISARRIDNERVFSIKDNGIGIDERHFKRIFVIFQQLNKRGSFDGTGMGLAIVKKIVERHRGRVWVESEAGVGSTFYVAIPDEPLT